MPALPDLNGMCRAGGKTGWNRNSAVSTEWSVSTSYLSLTVTRLEEFPDDQPDGLLQHSERESFHINVVASQFVSLDWVIISARVGYSQMTELHNNTISRTYYKR